MSVQREGARENDRPLMSSNTWAVLGPAAGSLRLRGLIVVGVGDSPGAAAVTALSASVTARSHASAVTRRAGPAVDGVDHVDLAEDVELAAGLAVGLAFGLTLQYRRTPARCRRPMHQSIRRGPCHAHRSLTTPPYTAGPARRPLRRRIVRTRQQSVLSIPSRFLLARTHAALTALPRQPSWAPKSFDSTETPP